MPLYTESIKTHHRSEMLEITERVQDAVKKSGVTEGLCIVHVPHTTAAVTINENADPDVKHDLLKKLETLIPEREDFYRHSEGNSDSHVKTSLVGNSVTIIVDEGKLLLGTWQGIQFCEFDGPRTRKFQIRIASLPY
jgi:secondary thiamine-phosphate synthase enzyme